MKIPLRILATLFICSAFGSGCNRVSQAIGLTPVPENKILFQDDFSDPASGWSVFNDGLKSVDYNRGAFQIKIPEAGFSYWSTPGLSLKDVLIKVDATKTGGPENNIFGVLCRYQDDANFYSLVISSDGYYGIVKTSAGRQSVIGAEGMRVSGNLQPGDAVKHIQAACIQDQLSLWVNGELLAQATDGDFASGDVGLVAGSMDEANVEISFDNFIVQKP